MPLSAPNRGASPWADTVTHVAVGFSQALLTDLDQLLPAGSVLVLEEPEVIAARDVEAKAHPCVAAVLAAPTQDEAQAERLIGLLRRPPRVRAVIPAVEYGVVGAAVLAHAWNLPGAGPAAARTLRDKIAMRTAAGTLDQPRWMVARSPADVEDFRSRHGGRCVLKPANRQASLGVQMLGPDDDAAAAWQRCVGADEPMLRASYALPGRYLVEERLDGPEVSVETLLHAGQAGFTNITAKSVQPGVNPVELGHVVPARLAREVAVELRGCVQELARITGFRSGLLHSEWILVRGRPHFIECAARLPGDNIDLLIDLAYGGRLTEDYLGVLEGRGPAAARPSRSAAAIRFLVAPAGQVLAVTGRELAAALPGISEVTVSVSPGTRIEPVTSSWTRLGHVTATGANSQQAEYRASAAAELITIEVDQELACR